MSKLSEIGAVELYKHQKDAYRDYMTERRGSAPIENKGGVLGGIGFIGEKTGAGFMQSIEGIWDFAAGGIADLVGADEWAEKQVANDWFGDWYETAGQWYNPGEGWRVAGDVAGGIGTTLPSVLATVGVGLATGGAGVPVAVTAFGTAATSAGGNAVKEAYRETGELGGKEWGYGALVGTTEGAIEAATGGIGKGSGALIKGAAKSFGKTAAKEAAEAAVKQSAKKSVGKLIGKAAWQVGSNFASEAIEEGVAEWVAPYYARMTYDPSAQNATAEEIGYASFIGGLSGVLFKGADVAITKGSSAYYYGKAGKDAIKGGRTDMILSTAKRVAEAEEASPSGYALLDRIKNDYNSIKKLGDKVDTVSGRQKLGALQMRLAATGYLPQVEQSAINILNNPEAAAEAYRKMGAVDENGAPIEITAEKLTDGIDLEAIAKMDGKEQMVALRRAISDNKLLLTMAVADATGNMMVDTETYASNAAQGALLGGRGAYQSFLENATPEQKRAVAERFGIEGDLDATSYNDFSTAAEKYRMSFEGASYISTTRSAIEAAKALPSNDRALPRVIGVTMKDGAYRYGDVTVIKDGDSVRFYDHQTGNLTREMTVKEANEALRSERKKALPDDTEASPEAKAKTETKIREIEAWAKENVKGYSELTPNERREIRAMIRQARALGIPDIDIGRYANLSARTRVRVSFSKDRCFYDFAEDGSAIYADGFYDPKANEIVVNPEGKRSAARLILHELSHALYKGKYGRVLNSRIADMEKSAREATERRYKEESGSVIVEEVAVRHAEDVLGNEKNLDRLLRDEPTIGDKILSFFGVARYGDDAKLSRAAGKLLKHFERAMNKVSRENVTGLTVETARGTMDDARFSLQFSDNIAENQRAYRDSHTAFVSADVLNKAIDDTAKMVSLMLPHKDILPSDTVGKKGSTLVKNGSYDVSVENTTVCIRTLAYNAFTDMVSEKIGRPLSQMESFLVSQKLYDIAKEPQCLYCYVSLDRKAFNEMIIRYTEQRDAAIKAWEDAGKPSPSRSSDLYEKFRAGRKDTDNMWKRYSEWISAAKSGEKLVTLSEVATESRRADIAQHGTASQKAQIADMLKYAQSASWAKKQTKYVAYYDDILRLSPKAVIDLNKHYGLRWYSFSDYSGAFIVENMQQVTDASLRGLKGLSYTKDVDFARIFAPTGMNINISVYATDINGKWEIDPKQSADIDAAIKLREQYPNVGIVVVAAKKEGVDWALAQKWSDVVIPFHIVRSGQDVANFYDWEVFNAEQGDTVVDENLWSQYVESLGNPKKASKNIYPSEHQNNRETYLDLCKSRGIKPRFSSFLDNPNYMKLVNETRQAEADTSPLKPKFDLDAAKTSFDKFVKKGGYYEGWYNDGIDVDSEVDTVAADVLAGKKANEVEYGRQDRNGNAIPTPDELMASRKASRSHGRRMALPDDFDPAAIVDRGLPSGGKPLSVGQSNSLRANIFRNKAFSRNDAMEVVNGFAGITELKKGTVEDITDSVWSALNRADSADARIALADDIAEFVVAKMYLESTEVSPDAADAIDRLGYYRMGIGNLSFSREDLSEIQHRVDTAGMRRILGRWGYKGKSRVKTPMDVFVADVARSMPGMEYLENMSPVDAFMEIDSLYESARETAGERVSIYDDAPPEAVEAAIKSIREEILRAYNEKGQKSRFTRAVEEKIAFYKETMSSLTIRGRLMEKANKLRDLKIGKFANATQAESDMFKTTIGKLSRINYRGNFTATGTRKILAELSLWYRKDNKVLMYENEANPGPYYSEAVEEALADLSKGDEKFSADEFQTLENIIDYFIWLYKNYGKIYRSATAQMVDVDDTSRRYIDEIHGNENLKVPILARLSMGKYSELFNDPMSVARAMDRYEDGFYTEIVGEIRKGAIEAQRVEMEIRRPYEDFLYRNKDYLKKARLDTVDYKGNAIPRITLISLYMSYGRRQAWKGLAVNGFVYTDIDGKKQTTVRGNLVLDGKDRKADETALEEYVKERRNEIEKLLTPEDMEYIAVLENIYNKDAKRLKEERDYQRRGITNVSGEYYYPIRRYATRGKSIDADSIQAEIDRISNASFNKDTVKGAAQALAIDPADTVIERHLPAVCAYYALSPVIDYYNAIYNHDISGNPNLPESVRTESEKYWKKGHDYISNLFSDAQGVRSSESMADREVSKLLGKARGAYAKYQLGANPKTLLTQFSSLFASSSILDLRSIMRGVTVSSVDVDKYCPLAELRAYENSAAMAQAVTDRKIGKAKQKVDRFGDILMAPIGKVDRFVIGRLFGACQVQIERDGGAKVGTDENKKAAGKLLERVILETQQNSLATERSAAMRARSELLRGLTMFSSDAMKVMGRVIDGVGEVSVLKARIKAETDAASIANLKSKLKAARLKERKAIFALILSSAFMVCISQLFRWLYNKDEDESIAEAVLVDFSGNMLGGLPVVRDLYSRFVEGYEMEDVTYSAVNDLLNSVSDVANAASNLVTGEGEPQERRRAIRNLAYSAGQITGIPVRNVYNMLFGLTKRIFPEAGYSVDNFFYDKNYEKDLAKAIEEGDDKMASYLFGRVLGEKIDYDMSDAVFQELLSLGKKGIDVRPRTVRDTVTIDGEEYELSTEEINGIREDYARYDTVMARLVKSDAYKKLGNEQREDVLKRAYDYTYRASESRVLGTKKERSVLLADAVGADKMAIFANATKDIEPDTDKNGSVIEGSRRQKVLSAAASIATSDEELLLLLVSKGYSIKSGDIKGVSADRAKKMLVSYITKQQLTNAEKEQLAEACGFTVKNGKIVMK